MASSVSNSVTEPAIIEQVVTELFAKSLHIILESRSPYVSSRNYGGDPFASSPSSSSSSSSGRPRDKWFNLALRDCPAALENFDLWRQSNLDPLVVDVVLARRPSASSINLHLTSPHDDLIPGTKSEKIVERWVVQYETQNIGNASSTPPSSSSNSKRRSGVASHSSEFPALYKKTYKRSIVLLRSLYVTVRLLPAYKVFRALNSSGQISPFSLSHRISSFVEPFTRGEEAEMKPFSFASVDTPCGRLCLSMSYIPKLEDVSCEPSTPLSTQLIADYFGSLMTDPLKRFQSLPSDGPVPTYVSLARNRSWSYDRGAPLSVSPSPSPTYSDSRALHRSPNPYTVPRGSIVVYGKNASFDEYCPSPPFSPSASPSPPTHLHSGHLPNALLRSESAPVSIPHWRNYALPNQCLPPSPSLKVSKHGCASQSDIVRAQVTTASAPRTSFPESRPQMKKESTRLGDFQAGISLQKVLSFGKDEVGNMSGLCNSPRILFSRSPSRLSFLDELDDSEFACPFAVDDEDLTDPCNRTDSSDGKGHEDGKLEARELQLVKRSPDAVVGALVRMLRTAPPLHQDLSNSVRTLQASQNEIWSERIQHSKDMEAGVPNVDGDASSSGITPSVLFRPRTTADALEELKHYKGMKESLLKHGDSHPLNTDYAAKSAGGGPL